MLLALAVAFGNGVISFAAPCTVALLPAYLGVLSGTSAGMPPQRRASRLVSGAMLYVAGFSLVFVVLGVVAGSAGRAMRVDGGSGQRLGGVLVLAVAVLMLAEARTGWLSKAAAGDGSGPGRSGQLWAPLALGVIFALAFAPCVGPFLATALAIAANGADAARGGLILFSYALGLGVPFVLAAMGVAGSDSVARRLARSRGRLCVAAAAVLGVLGLLLVSGRYGFFSGWLAKLVLVSST